MVSPSYFVLTRNVTVDGFLLSSDAVVVVGVGGDVGMNCHYYSEVFPLKLIIF